MHRVLRTTSAWLFATLFILAGYSLAHAQTIYISPAYGSYSVGQSFSVRVNISSPSQSVNAVSGTITYPPDKLQIVSLSKTDSIMSLWVQEPSFSGADGTVDFAGVILNPGFTGGAGRVVIINFKAVNSGTAKLGFTTGALLANDGNGTNVLSSLGTAEFNIGINGTVEPQIPVSGSNIPPPTITSSSHPDPKKWYTATTAQFSFTFPDTATQLKLLLDKQPTSAPTTPYAPPIHSKTLSNVGEGVWYMHAQYKTSAGTSDNAHFRINIDHTPPSVFTIKDSPDRDKLLARVPLTITATDDISYIDHYELSIDGGEYVIWKDSGDGVFTTPELFTGQHTINGRVFDAAGNTTYASLDFEIKGLPAPTITDYTKQISEPSPIFVKGLAPPNFTVRLYVNDNGKPIKVADAKSDQSGAFNVLWGPTAGDLSSGVLSSGRVHRLQVDAISGDGHITNPSEKVPLSVNRPFFSIISQYLINIFTIIVLILAFLALILFLIIFLWRKARSFRKEIRKEAKEAETTLHQAFKGMRENLESYVDMLEQANAERRLTDEEKKLVKLMKQNLDDAEKIIGKEIGDIERTAEK